jgi:hypothetical protein
MTNKEQKQVSAGMTNKERKQILCENDNRARLFAEVADAQGIGVR